MVYQDWQGEGKTKDEIRSDIEEKLKSKKSRNHYYTYESCIETINMMKRFMESDNSLPLRGANNERSNYLTQQENILKQRRDCCESDEKIKADGQFIDTLAEEIDDAENRTLELFRSAGGGHLLLALLQGNTNAKNLGDNGFEFKDNGNQTLNDLDLFRDISVKESYISATNGLPVRYPERIVKANTSEFILDYSGCSEDNLKKLPKALGTTEEELIKHNYMIEIRHDVGGNFRWQFYGTNNLFSGDETKLPAAQNLIIYEKMSYKSGLNIKVREHEDKIREEYLNEFDVSNLNWNSFPEENNLGEYLSFFPANSKLSMALRDKGPQLYNRFIVATENRVREIVNFLYTKHYTLKPCEPVSKLNFLSGLMEVHYRNERDFSESGFIKVWESGGINPWKPNTNDTKLFLGEELYKLIDGKMFGIDSYEDDYKTYLTNSIRSKLEKTKDIKPRDQLFNKNPTDPMLNREKDMNLEGLNLLKSLFQGIIEDDGNDSNIEKGLYLINQGIKNLKSGDDISQREFWDVILQPILDILKKKAPIYANDTYIQQFFNGTMNGDINSFRNLSKCYDYAGSNELAANFETEVDDNGEHKLKLKDADLQGCLDKIESNFSLDDDDINKKGEIKNQNKIEFFDNFYEFVFNGTTKYTYYSSNTPGLGIPQTGYAPSGIESGPKRVHTMLRSMGIIPGGPEYDYYTVKTVQVNRNGKYFPKNSYKENQEIVEICKNIYNNLNKKRQAADNIKEPSNKEIDEQRTTRLDELKKEESEGKLEGYPEKKEELDQLRIFETNPELARENARISIRRMKKLSRYAGINGVIRCGLIRFYGDKSGGTNSEIYDNINGFGLPVSDNNIQILEKIANEIIIFAATRYIGGGIYASIVKLGESGLRLSKTARIIQNCIVKTNKFLKSNVGKAIEYYTTETIKEYCGEILAGKSIDNSKSFDWSGLYEGFKSVVGSYINKGITFIGNCISVNKSLFANVCKKTTTEFAEESVNLTFGRIDENGNIVHDEKIGGMVTNVVGVVLAHCYNKTNNIKHDRLKSLNETIITNSMRGTFIYFTDDKGNIFVENTENNKVSNLENENAFEEILKK